MDSLRALSKRLPSAEDMPTLKGIQNTSLKDVSGKVTPRLTFLRRRIRLRGNSKVSVPLYLVLVFPII
ncbi:hypothetical protein KC336_g20951, partial [Hortaea werneckii]